MNAAINPLYSYTRNQKQSLYPAHRVGIFPSALSDDQATINMMKRGSGRPARRSSATIQTLVMPAWAQPNRALAATA